MGDRGNIVLSYSGTESVVCFYTHWRGTYLPIILAEALNSEVGRKRWDDDAYLARIIFDRLTVGFNGEETGFGISPFISDNEHPVLYVHLGLEQVKYDGVTYGYEEFIEHASELVDEQ